jgi:hypothetical protein
MLTVIFSIAEMTKTQLWTLIYFAGYLNKLVNAAVHVCQPCYSSPATFTQIQPPDYTSRPDDVLDHNSDTESQNYQDNDSVNDNNVLTNDDSGRGSDMIELCLPNYEI